MTTAKRIVTVTLTTANGQTKFEMKGNVAVKQYLINNGFTYTHACNCSGGLTYKFEYATTKGMLHVHVRASNFLFAKAGERFIKRPIAELKNMVDEVKRNYEAIAANA